MIYFAGIKKILRFTKPTSTLLLFFEIGTL